MKKLQNRKGFTLVELLIVMAIIGILLLLAVPRFTKSTEAATLRTVQANARTLASAAQTYYADNNKWPADVAALVSGKYISDDTYGANGTQTVTGTEKKPKPDSSEYKITGDDIVATVSIENDPGAKGNDVVWDSNSKTATIKVRFK